VKDMEIKRGQVAVTTENIFPIIRQWLYQDQDIFLRELVSNAADALSKLKRLTQMGQAEADIDLFRIDIVLDPDSGTLTIEDNGIGMSAEEIEKYINQIAYSGMVDFVERYKEDGADGAAFIGHFGLGFYSAFMVADKVRIDSVSYVGGPATYWVSEDGIDFEMGASDKTERGTVITLTLNEQAKKTLSEFMLRETLDKYLGFLAWPIYFRVAGKTKPDGEEKDAPAETPINDPDPLWKKLPKDITDEEYKAFYKKVFRDPKDPLFWIHLNLDYPFRLQGILYFPRTDNVYDVLDGRIKVYYNQVFVADNIKEILPEFLFLLRGVLDAPDLPLNVSRSFLQNDTYVGKLSSHIVRKVADKLTSLEKEDHDTYASYWGDIAVFVKYGMMRDDSFYDKVMSACLLETTEDAFESLSGISDGTLLYTPAKDQLSAYVALSREQGKTVYIMGHEIDNQFMSYVEYKSEGKKRFVRVDASVAGSEEKEGHNDAEALFRKISGDEKLEVKTVRLGSSALAAMFEEGEEARRFAELREQMSRFSDQPLPDDLFQASRTLLLNPDLPVVEKLLSRLSKKQDEEGDKVVENVARYLYDLARLGRRELDGEELVSFLRRSAELVEADFE
jgi:molecular chaperone HtpG